jgi:hypothetical protein
MAAVNNNFGLTTNLTLELEKTNALLNKFYENKQSLISKLEKNCCSILSECEITAKTLYTTNQELESSRSINGAIKDQQNKELETVKSLQFQNREQVSSMISYLKEMETLEGSIAEKQQLIKKEHELIKKSMEQKLQDFVQGTKYYKKMGLTFHKSTGKPLLLFVLLV